MLKEIILAGGCFWGVQATFSKVIGVIETCVGYIGGHTKNPTYDDVCHQKTGHAEAVKIIYDSEQINLSEILDLFFMIHDPTTPNRQGADKGPQYRSAIFYKTKANLKIIKAKIKKIQPYFKKPILTEVAYATHFYPAEEEHQNYYEKHHIHKCRLIELNKEAFLQKKLTHEQYWILRGKGTESPFSGKYIYTEDDGIYRCAACGQKLFSSDSKFQSDCGWPAFHQPLSGRIQICKDFSHFMIRDEVICSRCYSHLGHLFQDILSDNQERYCINSGALIFEPLKNP